MTGRVVGFWGELCDCRDMKGRKEEPKKRVTRLQGGQRGYESGGIDGILHGIVMGIGIEEAVA